MFDAGDVSSYSWGGHEHTAPYLYSRSRLAACQLVRAEMIFDDGYSQ